METTQIEKQFQRVAHFLWLILGASITFAVVSFGNLLHKNNWFGSYVGGIWACLLLLSTLPGLYLLVGRQWKSISRSSRMNTSFGYLAIGWLNLLSFAFIMSMPPATDYYILLVGSAIVIALGYLWAQRKTPAIRGEMFP